MLSLKKRVTATVSGLLLLAVFGLGPESAQAGIMVFSGPAGESLAIETTPGLGKDEVLVKLDGVSSPWSGKVFKALRETSGRGAEKYSFVYEIELTGQTLKKTYYVATDAGKTLVNGTLTRKITAYFEGGDHKGMELVYDADETKKSKGLDLITEFKKSPYKPQVE